MYCRKCGTQNDDNAYLCIKCGEVLQQIGGAGAPPMKIPNYLAQSILVTLFCCMPLGIPAIIFSAQVNGKIQAGDIPGALEASRKAKVWAWWSFGIGLISSVLYAISVIVGMSVETAGAR